MTAYFECKVLVDCHNLWSPWPRTLLDLEQEIGYLYKHIATLTADHLATLAEIEVRFYDGWRDIQGRPTKRAQLLVSLLPNIRGIRHGLRFLPSLAEGAVGCHWSPLNGTFRTSPPPGHQKMVDVLLAIDTIKSSEQCTGPVLLFSDDDDCVPAVLQASRVKTGPLFYIRHRPRGQALNDAWVSAAGVSIITV